MFKIPALPAVSEKGNKDETLKEFSMKDIEKGKVRFIWNNFHCKI